MADQGLQGPLWPLLLCDFPDPVSYPGFLKPHLVSGSARDFSEGEEPRQTVSPPILSSFSTLGFLSSPSVLNVLGPIPPVHTPVMASLLIGSALACLMLWG